MAMINRFLAQASKRQDLVFALFFVLIVAMLVFPLPTWLVDALLAVNLTLSLVVLITATYLKSPLDLSSFPSIILMTSIMRVALSVATTRLILATGDPGHLILAFGQFVIGGNIVVGLVIFLIIATVQFMVITKGAERISEVGARFTLDAMPGKQMAIDGDLRNGDITKEEAKRRRTNLQLEMQFHGAMDGAMRFVKGDAIASLIIVFVNLLGGLVIGMLQRGLSFSEAGRLYVLLSVGDGLIAQIPAMFIALAAGTIVTRVTKEDDEETNLGKDITGQLGAEPKALGVSGAVAAAMAFIPGFPTVVFLLLGAALGGLAYSMTKKSAGVTAETHGEAGQPGTGEGIGTAPQPEALPLRPPQTGDVMVISGHPGTLDLLRPDSAYMHVEAVKDWFQRRMGFSPPPVGYRYDPSIPTGTFVIDIDAVPVKRFEIPGIDPVQPMSAEQARTYAETVGRMRVRYASSIFGVPEAAQWLADVQPSCGRLATDIQQIMPFMVLVEALRRLLDDGVGLVPPRLVLEGLVAASQRSQDPDVVAEVVRGYLRRQICFSVANADKIIDALVLAPDAEATLRQGGGADQGAAAIRGAEEATRRMLDNARAMLDGRADESPAVIMTAPDTRRIARKMLRQHDLDAVVLSYGDVAAEYQVRTIGVISAGERAAA